MEVIFSWITCCFSGKMAVSYRVTDHWQRSTASLCNLWIPILQCLLLLFSHTSSLSCHDTQQYLKLIWNSIPYGSEIIIASLGVLLGHLKRGDIDGLTCGWLLGGIKTRSEEKHGHTLCSCKTMRPTKCTTYIYNEMWSISFSFHAY